MRDVFEKWDERLGLSHIRASVFDRVITADVNWLHTLGSVCTTLVAVLVLTGMLLALNYSPDPGHAYHSVRYIETEVTLGHLVRGLHHWAASFLIVAVVLHLLHTAVSLAFARPREATWITGVLMLLTVLALGFTGYLLPWDEKAYWATVVGTNMAGQVPVVGESILRLIRGGTEVGAATLTHFYGLHLTFLPLVLGLLIAAHLFLVILHGISSNKREPKNVPMHGVIRANPNRAAPAEKNQRIPFWPNVLALDAAAALLILAVLFGTAALMGAPLEAPADPTETQYIPRPEWYFLPLFKLLALFPGSAEAFAAVGVPAMVVLLLLTMPWWSRRLLETSKGRKALVGGSGGTLAVVVLLGLAALESQPARTLAAPEVARGRLLFETLGCRNCHSLRGLGGVVGPDLALVGLEHRDTAQFRQQLQDPQSHAADTPMPTFPLKGERMRDLVSFLASLGNDLRYTSEAPGLYRDNCSICHQLAGEGVGVFGPDLAVPGRIHSVAYVHQYIEEPSLLFSEASMPPSQSLTHEQVEDIARYVVATALRAEAQER